MVTRLIAKKLKFLTVFVLSGAACAHMDSADLNREPAWEVSAQDPEFQEAQRLQEELKRQRIRQALQQQEIIIGMTASEVRSVWGEPRSIDTAGDSRSGNQRWTYFDGLSSRWSTSSARTVYFEEGRVVGWQTR